MRNPNIDWPHISDRYKAAETKETLASIHRDVDAMCWSPIETGWLDQLHTRHLNRIVTTPTKE